MALSRMGARAMSLWTLIIFIMTGALYRLNTLKPKYRWYQPYSKSYHSNEATTSLNTSYNPKTEEIQKILKLLEWPEPPNFTSFLSSTSPDTTEFSLLDPRTTYQVGEHVKVLIRARDHYGHPKTYGGDYFQAKMHSPQLKSGVTGSITDHRNGSYTATFLLLWPGICNISISLVHSSEAITILRKKRETRPDKVYYAGYFHYKGKKAVVECNAQPPGQDVCSYRDSHTGEEWFCVRPQGFPCSSYLEHSGSGNREILTSAEQEFLNRRISGVAASSYGSIDFKVVPTLEYNFEAALTQLLEGYELDTTFTLTSDNECDGLNKCHRLAFPYSHNRISPGIHSSVSNKMISSALPGLVVQPQNRTNEVKAICKPGLSNPEPSGYYYQDKWNSRVCRNRNFRTPADITSCLKGKVVYMFGDSTLRQWWEYLVDFVPSLQRVDLHVSYAPGPLLATDTEHGLLLQWQAHQRPLSMKPTRLQELKYIANELDGMGGGDDGLVIVINCLAHFIFFPVNVYLRRMIIIRDAVARLLERSPRTKVIIKSGNTGFLCIHGSDWLSLQLDMVMRAVFSGLPVTILDAWQMTSCHYLPKAIHPKKIIIQNMVDLMLSFICPK